jgi:hypothetical protein
VTDPAAPVEVGLAQVLGALARRRERRREAVAELGGAVTALAQAVERHAARVAEVRRAVEARGGDPAPLRDYDEFLARLRSELGSAERSLADVVGEAADGAAASR